MNAFLNENIAAILLFLLLTILGLIAFMGIVIVKLLSHPKNAVAAPTEPIPTTVKKTSIKQVLKDIGQETVTEKFYCENHPDLPSIGACLICEDVFCEKCLVEHDGMYFCKEHFRVFANHKWKQITDVKTTPDTPEEGLFIYRFKRHLWKEHQTPTYVLTHYKINIEDDMIESFIQLHVMEGDKDRLAEDILKFKAEN